jgi:hypothetical protein
VWIPDRRGASWLERTQSDRRGEALTVTTPKVASDLADHAVLEDQGDPATRPSSLGQVGQRDRAVEDLDAGDTPLHRVVLE